MFLHTFKLKQYLNTMSIRLFILVLLITGISPAIGQTVFGEVTDAITGDPLEGVSIYFNQSTYGTTSNQDGIFTLTTEKLLKSSLIISSVGYQTVVTNKPYEKKLNIRLFPEVASLETVVIEKDLWTRQQKLLEFKRQFIGTSFAAKQCRILNEDDIDLSFISSQNALIATADRPIVLYNPLLNYKIQLDLKKFRAVYKTNDPSNKVCTSVYTICNSLFTNIVEDTPEKARENRIKMYKGSIPHFIKSIYDGTTREHNFKFYEFKKIQAISSYSLFDETFYSKEELKKKRLSLKKVFKTIDNTDGTKVLEIYNDFLLDHPNFDAIQVSKRSATASPNIYSNGFFDPGNAIQFTFGTDHARMSNLLPFDYLPTDNRNQ